MGTGGACAGTLGRSIRGLACPCAKMRFITRVTRGCVRCSKAEREALTQFQKCTIATDQAASKRQRVSKSTNAKPPAKKAKDKKA